MNEDLSIDYEVWDLENEFSPITVACLWCGVDPNKESHNQSLLNKVLKMKEILSTAARERRLSVAWPQGVPCLPSGGKDAYDAYSRLGRELKFDRTGLKAYAESIGQRPLFLFFEERRSGQRISTLDTSKNNLELFDALLSHPKIIKVSRSLFADGHYASAILEAFKAVNNAVKKKTGIKDKDGQTLMGLAFNPESPIIKLNSLKTQSDKDEQSGFKLLYMGAMTGIRNPKAHDHVTQADPLRTLKYLAFASLLMERLGESTRSRRKSKPAD